MRRWNNPFQAPTWQQPQGEGMPANVQQTTPNEGIQSNTMQTVFHNIQSNDSPRGNFRGMGGGFNRPFPPFYPGPPPCPPGPPPCPPGPPGPMGPTGPTAPSIYAQQGKCRNHAAFSTLKTIKQPL